MKKRSAILCAIALVAAFACTKETNKIDEKNETLLEAVTEVVGASLDNDTKATVATADGIFNWTEAVDYVAFYNGTTFVKSNAAAATGTSTTFTITYTGTRSDYAYFPYYLVQDPSTVEDGESMTTANTTQVVLPSTYALTAISDENTPCPMIAANVPGEGWAFKQLCGLFRLTVNSIPSDATGLLVDFHGHKVHGTFDVTGAGTATPSIATAVDNTNDQITVTFAAGTTSATLNLPLPVGDYNDVSITPIGSSTKVSSTRHIKAGGYTAVRARGKKLTATLVSFTSGKKKYIFAPGNLQAKIATSTKINSGSNSVMTTDKWSFADYQYSYIGKSGSYVNLSVGATMDLFTWVGDGATYNTYGMLNINNATGDYNSIKGGYLGYGAASDTGALKSDFGENAIDSYVSGDWFTPTWGVYSGIINRAASHAKATVAGAEGLIILPDQYVHPAALSEKPLVNLNNGAANFTDNNYTADEWALMEEVGAAFLPDAGMRISINYYTGATRYFTSTTNKLYIVASTITAASIDRYYGLPVRLLREIGD